MIDKKAQQFRKEIAAIRNKGGRKRQTILDCNGETVTREEIEAAGIHIETMRSRLRGRPTTGVPPAPKAMALVKDTREFLKLRRMPSTCTDTELSPLRVI